jgi:predicted RNA polymerase sigma factor
MLLTAARRPARTTPHGDLVPLGDQDRGTGQGPRLGRCRPGDRGLSRGNPGPYQLQAAIAAVHAEADRVEDTDWPQILALDELLERVDHGNPAVTLNQSSDVADAGNRLREWAGSV